MEIQYQEKQLINLVLQEGLIYEEIKELNNKIVLLTKQVKNIKKQQTKIRKREKAKILYQNNREKFNKQSSKYYYNHREEMLIKQREYNNKPEIKEGRRLERLAKSIESHNKLSMLLLIITNLSIGLKLYYF